MRLWQRSLCESLGLRGRILVSKHGINGTLGGDKAALKLYIRQTKEYEGFRRTDFKWSEGGAKHFAKLRVRLKKELVTFDAEEELLVGAKGVIGGGKHLKPEEVNQLVRDRGDEVVFFDGRNAFEARIGKFKNAVVPNVETTHDFMKEIESGRYDHLKNKPVVTYCTGGIRCEILSVAMKNRGFQEVYQIKGGIVRYGQKFGDRGLWEGSLYVFDDRMNMEFSKDAKVIGKCEFCDGPTSKFHDFSSPGCRDLVLLCSRCVAQSDNLACVPTHTRGKRINATVG